MSNAAAQIKTPEASATTCIVGCKLPHGFKVELFDKAPDKKDRRVIWSHVLKGNNAARIYGGYGLTEGVDADKMTEWLKRNAEHPAVKNGLIFMHTDTASAISHAKDGALETTGFEPLDPIADAKKHRLDVDPAARAAYEKQKAENPMRNRQIVE